jgi:DNA-binding transcriptional MerR regulator
VEGWAVTGVTGATGAVLGTSAVARAAGCSVQLVRDLERLGAIPAPTRSPNGYRRFTPVHVRAVRAYRDLALAFGPVVARRFLSELRGTTAAEGAARVSALHVSLDAERRQALAARAALCAVRDEAGEEAPSRAEDTMTITELAGALGVRSSTLRFWEAEGLLLPERVTTRSGTARRYPVPAVREARVVAALRAGGYRVPDVRRAVVALRDLGEVGESLTALDRRLELLGERALALLRAGAALADLIGSQDVPDVR